MKCRFVLPLFAAAALTAVTGPVTPVAAQETAAPGTIRTVAGSGLPGFSGDGGPATQARLDFPLGIAIDAAGNVFFADGANSRIRKVSPDGTITTVAGSGPTGPDMGYASGDGGPALQARMRGPLCLAVDGAGNLFETEQDPAATAAYTGPKSQVRKISPDGIITSVACNGVRGFSGDSGPAVAASLDLPRGVAVDSAGNLYVADTGNNRVLKYTPVP
jgi:DNA-binding beta-propeller fold protein YncE